MGRHLPYYSKRRGGTALSHFSRHKTTDADFENKLYFRTDKSYVDGALDWTDNAVRWINLSSYLDTGDLPMVRENALISDFHVHEGLITIYYSYPDAIDTTMLYADKDMAFNQKTSRSCRNPNSSSSGLALRSPSGKILARCSMSPTGCAGRISPIWIWTMTALRKK